jgi:hypothetical protein
VTEPPAPEQPTPIDEIKRGASFARDHLLWVLGLIPLVFAGLRVIVASGGNAETLKSLVQDLDVTALALATLLPFFSTVLLWCFFIAMGIDSERTKKKSKTVWLFFGSIVLIVVWVTMPLSYLLANMAALFGLFVIATAAEAEFAKSRWPIVRKLLVGFGAIVVPIVIISAPFVLAGVWLPREQITITGQSDVLGYVLSSDMRWTKYMDENDKIHIVASSAVVQRESADDTRAWYHQTLSDLTS